MLEDIRCAKKEITLMINNFDSVTLLNLLLEFEGLSVRIISNLDLNDLNIEESKVTLEKYETAINSIIVDSQFIWYGEINPFKECIFEDSIMRIDDVTYANELVLELKNQ